MRKFLFVFVLVIGVFGVYVFANRTSNYKDEASNSDLKDVLASEKTENQVVIDGYTTRLLKVQNIDNLFLGENFGEKKNASDIYKDQKCSFLVNGGFYIRNEAELHKPTGYFVTQGKEVGKYLENKTLNGVLSVNQFGVVRITRGVPSGDLRWAVQTGPVLFENGAGVLISMATDKNARRVVALVDGDNNLYFVVFYTKDSVYSGPTLEEMPGLLRKFASESGINLADAVNLDGGSASAFMTKDFSLTELSPIGSYFCLQGS